jgi:hypothetical protein
MLACCNSTVLYYMPKARKGNVDGILMPVVFLNPKGLVRDGKHVFGLGVNDLLMGQYGHINPIFTWYYSYVVRYAATAYDGNIDGICDINVFCSRRHMIIDNRHGIEVPDESYACDMCGAHMTYAVLWYSKMVHNGTTADEGNIVGKCYNALYLNCIDTNEAPEHSMVIYNMCSWLMVCST